MKKFFRITLPWIMYCVGMFSLMIFISMFALTSMNESLISTNEFLPSEYQRTEGQILALESAITMFRSVSITSLIILICCVIYLPFYLYYRKVDMLVTENKKKEFLILDSIVKKRGKDADYKRISIDLEILEDSFTKIETTAQMYEKITTTHGFRQIVGKINDKERYAVFDRSDMFSQIAKDAIMDEIAKEMNEIDEEIQQKYKNILKKKLRISNIDSQKIRVFLTNQKREEVEGELKYVDLNLDDLDEYVTNALESIRNRVESSGGVLYSCRLARPRKIVKNWFTISEEEHTKEGITEIYMILPDVPSLCFDPERMPHYDYIDEQQFNGMKKTFPTFLLLGPVFPRAPLFLCTNCDLGDTDVFDLTLSLDQFETHTKTPSCTIHISCTMKTKKLPLRKQILQSRSITSKQRKMILNPDNLSTMCVQVNSIHFSIRNTWQCTE